MTPSNLLGLIIVILSHMYMLHYGTDAILY